MTVFRPSLPPAICTTINVRSLAACAKWAPCCDKDLAEATPRLKMAGITIPADTTSIPSFIIALRESFIMVFPLCLIQMIFGRCHHQVQRATYTVDWIALAIAKRYLLDYFATIARIEVIDEQCTSVCCELAIKQER